MPIVTKEVLKAYFLDGKVVGEEKYVDLIDTFGDMHKGTYDTDDDGKVNSAVNADIAPWSGLTGVPSTFTPSAHTHGGGDITSQVADADTVDSIHGTNLYRKDQDLIANGYDIRTSLGLSVGDVTLNPADGEIHYTTDLRPSRSAVYYTGYIFVPCIPPLTGANFNGDSFSTTTYTLIDMSAEFGIPALAKAVSVRIIARDSASLTTSNLLFGLWSQVSTGLGDVLSRPSGLINDQWFEANGIVPLVNGDCYYQVTASGSGTLDAWIIINGYFI